MKDFLNCYEKLDVDYSSLRLIYDKVGYINNSPTVVSRRIKTNNELEELRRILDTVELEVNNLCVLVNESYSVERDTAIEKKSVDLESYLSVFFDTDILQYDENRRLKLVNLADKFMDSLKKLENEVKGSDGEEKDYYIQSLANNIKEDIFPSMCSTVGQPYIDELHQNALKAALTEFETVKFPIKSDVPLKKNAILHNAYNIEETHELNNIYHLSFAMPIDDTKLDSIQPNGFIRYNEDGQLYRITKKGINHEDADIMTVEAEHAITTLCNDVMYGSYTYGGNSVKTKDVINYLLGFQKTTNWVLGGCDFDRRFEYTWKHETILSALFSIPKEFGEDYMWDYDTTVYPWKLYLRKLDKNINPEFYIRAKRNLIGAENSDDYSDIYTRVYALGYENGDGVQLDISSVNGGIPYVEAKPEIMSKYGLITTILIDRRFENAESLKAYAESYLYNAIEPGISRSFDVVDLYPITNSDIDNARVGALTRLTGDGTTVFITKTKRIHDQPGNLTIELSTKSTTLANQIADIAYDVKTNKLYY